MAPISVRGSLRPSQSGPHSYVFLALLLMVVVLAFNYWSSSSKNSELLEQLSNIQHKHKVCYDEVIVLRKASVKVEHSLELSKKESSEQMLQINKLQIAGKDYMEQIDNCGRNISLMKTHYKELIDKTNQECERQVEESRSRAETSCSKEKDGLMKDQERAKEEEKQQLQQQQQKEQQLQLTIQQQEEELKKMLAEQIRSQTKQHGEGKSKGQKTQNPESHTKGDLIKNPKEGQQRNSESHNETEEKQGSWSQKPGEGQQKDNLSQKQGEGQQKDSENQKQGKEGQQKDVENQKQGDQLEDNWSQEHVEGPPKGQPIQRAGSSPKGVQEETGSEQSKDLKQDGEERIKLTGEKKEPEDMSDHATAVPVQGHSPRERNYTDMIKSTEVNGTLLVSSENEQSKDNESQNANTTWVLQPPKSKDSQPLKFGTDHAPGLRPAHWIDRARRPDELQPQMQQGSTGIQSAGAFAGKRESGKASTQTDITESLEGQRGISTNVEDASKQQVKKIGKPGQREVAGSPGQLGGITNLEDENQENIEMNGEGGRESVKENMEMRGYLDHGVGHTESQDIERQKEEER